MVNIYKTYENQTWLDISNHLYGRVDYSFELAKINNASVSDNVLAGQIVVFNPENEKDTLVLKVINEDKSIPATGTTAAQNAEIPTLKGIGYMKISGNFIVS